MGVRNSILLRIRIAFVIVGLFALGILYQVGKLQSVDGAKWREVSRTSGFSFREVEATRGDVLSDDGRLLASSLPFYQVALDPTQAPDSIFFSKKLDSLAAHLSHFFGEQDTTYYVEMLTQARADTNRYKMLSRKLISFHQMEEMKTWPIFRMDRIGGGVLFHKEDRRFRPYGSIARRTIGFVPKDSLPGRGLEKSFHEQLAGQDGEALFQRVSSGWKPVYDENRVMPINGRDVVTTLDIEVQQEANDILKKHLKKHRANYGCLILMEVKTGEIKAMVNLGRSQGEYVENYNYAIGSQGVKEPGSTFKLASMMAILEEDPTIQLTDTVNSGDGKYKYEENCVMTDDALYGYGMIPVRSVFEKSSNIGVSRMVYKVFEPKPEKYIEYLRKFGLTEPLGFQMQGEGAPFVNNTNLDTWSGCSLPWMSIGYEVKLSPLQILAFYNGIANDGRMITPIIAKEIRDGQLLIDKFEAKVINPKLCSDRTLSRVKELLVGVVKRGTARGIRSDEYTIAGKTGTAQKLKNGRYTKNYYASFVGYFPAEKPSYSCIVVVDQPRGNAQYGGEVAAPVFRELADWLYIRRNTIDLKPTDEPAYANAFPVIKAGYSTDLTYIANELGIPVAAQNSQEWVRSTTTDSVLVLRDQHMAEETVPNVIGMTLKDALYLLENKGMQVRSAGRGRVTKQSLRSGTKIRNSKQVIYIRLG